MTILALQLKRIGDVILTTPALAALREAWPGAGIHLIVADACGELQPAIPEIDRGIAFRRGTLNWNVWKDLASTRFDLCLDFTGNDRSALLSALSMARRRLTFAWVGKSRWRARAYHELIDSSVRERHTADHYLDLADVAIGKQRDAHIKPAFRAQPHLTPPGAARESSASLMQASEFVVIHPGTARPEKYWVPERWAEVITHLTQRWGIECVITGGADPFEREHIEKIQNALRRPVRNLAGKLDLLTFAAVVERARACVSCDTAVVHIAAAFNTPQITLYGPTNPYHWRARHPRAIVLSSARSDGPLTGFNPTMKGAPMEALSTALVIRATDSLLSASDR